MTRVILAFIVSLWSVSAVAQVTWVSGDSGIASSTRATLNRMAEIYGGEIRVTSGLRDAASNASAGGAQQSQHLGGHAVDISLKGLSVEQRQNLLRAGLEAGFGGVGFYGNDGHLHLDTGPTRTWGQKFDGAEEVMNQHFGNVDRSKTPGAEDKRTNDATSQGSSGNFLSGLVDRGRDLLQGIGQTGISGDKIMSMVKALENECWACQGYELVFNGASRLIGESFAYLTQTPAIVGFALVILAISMALSIMKIIGRPINDDGASRWVGLFGFFARISVIFLFFFGVGAVDSMRGPGGDHPIRTIFIDGPLGIGTDVGCMAIRIAGGGGQGSGSIDQAGCAAGGGEGESLAQAHLEKAKAILLAFHRLGVNGMAAGLFLVVEAPAKMSTSNMMPAIAAGITGLVMTVMFFMFTVTFGLRYLDALLRTTVIAALLPIFLYLWIFEGMKNHAKTVLMSILYVGAVFAASGFVYAAADQIMCASISRAMGGECTNFASSISAGGFSKFVGGDGTSINWMTVFILLGSAAIVIQLASIVFTLASFITESKLGEGNNNMAATMQGRFKDTIMPFRMLR